MIKKCIWAIFFLISVKAQAQYKPDVLVFGSSAAGCAAAIQSAKSGVKTLLISQNEYLIGDIAPNMKVKAFDAGIWKEWKDQYQKSADTIATDPRTILAEIIKNTKGLTFITNVEVSNISQKNKGWELKVKIDGKTEEIKCKILIDATFDAKNSLLAQFNVIDFDKNGNFLNIIPIPSGQKLLPENTAQKLFRTSVAAGFGKDSTQLKTIPLGVFIPQEKENLLMVSVACFKNDKATDLNNLALWVNMGQAVGALAAYGPYFDTSPDKANIRMTQGEMFTHKSFLYPLMDIAIMDASWVAIQKIIAAGILKFDYEKGKFNPNGNVSATEVKTILSELYPRSRIWFIENKIDQFTLAQTISLMSFISGKDPITMQQEAVSDWKTKYKFVTNFVETDLINREEFTVLVDAYLAPFSIRVDFGGNFLR
jgi:hypothetical protein